MHFDFNDPVAGTIFAASTLNVETETPRSVAPKFSFRRLRKKFTDRCKDTGISRRIGPLRAADWRLVNNNSFVQQFNAFYVVMSAGHCLGAHQPGRKFTC